MGGGGRREEKDEEEGEQRTKKKWAQDRASHSVRVAMMRWEAAGVQAGLSQLLHLQLQINLH